MEEIENKVAQSGLLVVDLAQYLPDANLIKTFDIKPFLFQELLLREKDFRAALKTWDWSQYEGYYVAVTCSSDAIVPMWAYMLIGSYLDGIARAYKFTTAAGYRQELLLKNIQEAATAPFEDARVVIKGCGDTNIGEAGFLAITARLKPVVKSLMYGEPCSTVPVYKRK